MFYKHLKLNFFFRTNIKIAILSVAIFTINSFSVSLIAQNLPHPLGIAVEADGNILVADEQINTVYRIDKVTGEFTVLADENTGNGPMITGASDLEVEADGNILLNSFTMGIVYRIDPITGDRSIVAGDNNGNGTNFKNCAGIAVEADGTILVTDSNNSRIFRVDPISGDRTIIADYYTGTGPDVLLPYGIAVEPDGNIIATNALTHIIRINAITGERTILSDANIGSGPLMDRPFGLAVDSDGFIYATDKDIDGIFKIDPVTGDRTILTTCPTIDPAVSDLLYIALEADGNLVVTDSDLNAVFRVNPSNGNCTYISAIGSPIKELNITELAQIKNTPNPFSTITRINFEVPNAGEVQVLVVNMLGQPVRELVNEFIPKGKQSIQWDGRDNAGQPLSTGAYFLQIVGKKYKGVHKMTLIN